jgi:hypothetical protein
MPTVRADDRFLSGICRRFSFLVKPWPRPAGTVFPSTLIYHPPRKEQNTHLRPALINSGDKTKAPVRTCRERVLSICKENRRKPKVCAGQDETRRGRTPVNARPTIRQQSGPSGCLPTYEESQQVTQQSGRLDADDLHGSHLPGNRAIGILKTYTRHNRLPRQR